jgi:16S rRNA (uracil1498-N3)-methyltransferase
MTLPRFVVGAEELRQGVVALRGPEFHHLRVRRVRPGGTVMLCDAEGRQRLGVVVAIDRQAATIALADEVVPSRESPLQLTLAQAVLKGNKLDLVVEKAVELGVTEIVIFTTERSIGPASGNRLERWNRIARSAAKQCQRSSAPRVHGTLPFTGVLRLPQHGAGVVFSEQPAPSATLPGALPETPRAAVAMVGPEGGFTAMETVQATALGFHRINLGPRILRAETAAIVAVTLCQFLWGDLSARRPSVSGAGEG